MANSQTFTFNIKAVADMKDVQSNIQNIQSALKQLKLPESTQNSFKKTFGELEKELDRYQKLMANGFKTKGDATALEKSGKNILSLYDKVVSTINSIDDTTLKKAFEDLGSKEVENLKNQLSDLQNTLKTTVSGTVGDSFKNLKNSFKDLSSSCKTVTEDGVELGKELQKISSSTLTTFINNITNGRFDLAEKNFENLKERIAGVKEQLDAVGDTETSKGLDSWLTGLTTAFEELKTNGNIQPLLDQIAKLKTDLKGAEGAVLQNLANSFKTAKGEAEDFGNTIGEITEKNNDFAASQAQVAKEIDQIKSRIQYFFGLSNAINLVKRAIRGAVDTIKELDKAMTATAVVTDFTVSDMWEQLPEYTKRANELGVTTLAAYEAATLYYQQGLKTNEVNALSVETLKMARIAGLDAAEATDRMTNALRGFNMELTTANAQRVDDVYSELAANTASNVDEISTAMTKVASLAHNANMEFETTAAFLAQIIETTRESAETAGTALKTVVARFSEVKKLVDEGSLRGTDEEGQTIDVNRVGAALRTAGIDLNKYFLGEVGLDDIFMELASKWDTLTSVQQRYIATQAAGSRQQSRFIALMQDYARTQELVGKAYNANGASARQFAKTQESLESKLNRLKNAWNEFLMGLTNNEMVKGFVDILTNLLNLLNKITSGFDGTTNSILKFTAALAGFAGLKSLFKSGGILDTVLGTVVNGTGLGNALFSSKVLSGKIAGGVVPGSAAAEAAVKATGGGQAGGIGALIGGAGKSLWSGFQALGTKAGLSGGLLGKAASGLDASIMSAGGSAELAMGLTGVATALGAVAVAVGLVVAGYQAWLRLTPEGQLKQAQKIAEVMNNVAANTQDAANEMKQASDQYRQYTDAVNNASNVEEHNEAIQNRNEYINSLLEQNEAFAKYVSTEIQEGQLVLTVDDASLNEAIQKVAEAATNAATSADLANAMQSGKQADVFEARIRRAGVDLENRTIRDYDGYGNEITRALTDAEYIKFAQYAQAAENARAEQRAYAAQGYGRQLEGTGLEDNVASMLASAMADAFDEDQYLKDINAQRSENWWSGQATLEQLRADYKELYGVDAGDMKRSELARAVAQGQVDQQRAVDLVDLTNLLQGEDKDQYKALLEAYQGAGKMTEINLEGINDTTDLAQLFGFDELDTSELEAFAAALGTDVDALTDHIKAQIEQNKQIQRQKRTNVFEAMMRAGMTITSADQARINNMTPEQVSQISETTVAAEDLLSAEDYQNLISGLIEGTISQEFASELTTLFNSIDLSNPIGAFNDLAAAKEEASKAGNQELVEYINKIQSANEELFTASNLVQSFIASADYDELTESLDKFIKDNGRISADNIEDLAKENKLLKQLLDSNTVSTKALANALTLVQEGKIGFEQLTDAMLKALEAGTSFEEMMEGVDKWIKDFDPGTDLKEGTEHIIDQLKDLKEYVSNWEFGNEPTKNIYEHIFGEGTYDQLVDHFGNDFEAFEKFVNGKIEQYSSMAENAGLGGIQAATAAGVNGLKEIAGSGGQFFEWDLSQFGTTTEAIDSVASALGVTQEAAEAFILSWQTHMPKLRAEWDELTFQTRLESFITNLGESGVATEEQLIALGAAVDESGNLSVEALQEVIDKINATRAAAGEGPIDLPVIVSWKDESGGNLTGDSLINEFKTKFLNKPIDAGDNLTADSDAIESTADDTAAQFAAFLGDAFDEQAGTVNYGEAMAKLLGTGLSEGQAEEVLDAFVTQLNAKLTEDVKLPSIEVDDNGNSIVKTITESVEAVDCSALKSEIEAKLEGANYNLIANEIAEVSLSGLAGNVKGAIESGASEGASEIADIVAAAGPVEIHYYWIADNSIDATPSGSSAPGANTHALGGASGGIVRSYASGTQGTRFLQPGFALTGEEGPEIVWNKEQGYAYVTGQNGAEFQDLKPGDRVFNAAETQRIFRNSSFAKGGYFDSYASGGWKPTAKKTGGGSGSSSDNGKKESTWRNELDWLYDLMEDIAEYERQQTILQSKYDLSLKDLSATGKDLFRLTQKELINLETQLTAQTTARNKRLQQMMELQTQVNAAGYGKYIQYNQKDQTLEINWDKIEAIQDKEEYDEVTDWLDRMESVQDQIDDAEDAIWDIKKQIQELQERYLQKYLDFQNKVLDALVAQYQATIDNLSALNNTLNDTNSEILDSIQREIDLQRQIRDNTDIEDNIADLEARLAYLQRDTTGANAAEIRNLQKQLDDARENYNDTLIDQAIDRLAQSNEDASTQREKQIELMQAQLDYWQESGALWGEVADLIANGFNETGAITEGSSLWEILKDADNWNALSEAQKKNWANELILEANEVGAHLIQLSGGNEVNSEKVRESIADERGILTQNIAAAAETVRASIAKLQGQLGGTPEHSYTATKTEGYASGGLTTKTGPTILHGTPTEPEYVLNARQTEAFLKLADILPTTVGNTSTITNTYGGNVSFNVDVNVGSISDDYDVDSLVARIKEDLYDAATYRNGNVLGFLR